MATNSPAAYTPLRETTIDLTDTDQPVPRIDNESGSFGTSKNSQLGFIQKVLSIKFLQILAVTLITIGFVGGGYPVHVVLVLNLTARINFIVLSTLVFLAVVGSLNYCKDVRTAYPYNYIFLVAFPVSGGVFGCVIFYGWALNSMLVSWVHFNFVMLALLLYSILAFEPNIEFTARNSLFIAGSLLIVMYVFTVPFVYDINGFAVLYFSIMMFLTIAYILYEIEAMVSKDYHTPLTPADFVKASVLMHVDHRYLLTSIYKKHIRSSQAVYD